MSPGLQLIHIGVYLKILRLSRLFTALVEPLIVTFTVWGTPVTT